MLYGGARGPGKSYWLRWTALSWLLYWFLKFNLRGVRFGLFCETYPDLRDRQISKIELEFPLWLGEIRDTKEDGLGFFVRPQYGSGILALRNLDDPAKYQSAEFAGIAIDELTKNTKAKFDVLRGSKRWPGISHTPFIAGTNPGGIGHGWVKQLWLDRNFPSEMRPLAKEFKFIRALPKDNPFLSEEYWLELNTQPERLRRAWVEGDWSVFEGQAFTAWREDLHIVKPFEIPTHWNKWRAVDWGYAKPWCCLWFTRHPDTGRIYIFREVYASGVTDTQQAKTIMEMSPEGATLTYADPSMWATKVAENRVTTTADAYAAQGVSLLKADNDRLSGKRKVDRLLAALPDGMPGLQVFRTCTNLIRTLPELASDEHNPEDVDTNQEDHAYDTLKYGLTSVAEKKKQDEKPKRADRGLGRVRGL